MIAPQIPFDESPCDAATYRSASVDRDARLADIRLQVEAGTYETAERLAASMDALLERLLPSECHAGLQRRPLHRF